VWYGDGGTTIQQHLQDLIIVPKEKMSSVTLLRVLVCKRVNNVISRIGTMAKDKRCNLAREVGTYNDILSP
jgi:hypothetical protein